MSLSTSPEFSEQPGSTLLMSALAGAPIMMGAAGAAGAAYLATTSGETGDKARQAGHLANQAVSKAAEANEKHHITQKVLKLQTARAGFSEMRTRGTKG